MCPADVAYAFWQGISENPRWQEGAIRPGGIMAICMALLERRLDTSLALSTTTLAVPTSLERLCERLHSQWPTLIRNIAERIVNAFAFGEAGSARAKLAAAVLTGALCSIEHTSTGKMVNMVAFAADKATQPIALLKR